MKFSPATLAQWALMVMLSAFLFVGFYRLNDIVFEVQKNIQYAERQAKRAERYKQELEKLKGLTIAEATDKLAAVNLVLGTQTPQVDNNTPKDHIIGQDPSAGESLQEGQKVNITISNGKEQTVVPDLVKLTTRADADLALRDAKLLLGNVTVQDSDQKEGTVLAQSLPAGSSADIGTRVDITISSGKLAVPDVKGESKTQAKNDLINAGFKVQIVAGQGAAHY